MKIFNILVLISICIISSVKADSKHNIISELKKGGKLIFIRHAYAPGGGDPENFDIDNCATQRNLNNSGRMQSNKIGDFFKKNNIPLGKVFSSEWCRCKDTASIAFKKFETKSFLNSFFSEQFAKNKKNQIKDFYKFIDDWDKNQNLIFITHYVVISEILNYAPSSGEIVVSDKYLKVIDTLEIEY